MCTVIIEALFFGGESGHPVLSWLIIAYAAVSCVYLVKEIVDGYRGMEKRVAALARKEKANE